MTIKDYLTSKFEALGVFLNASNFADCEIYGLDIEEEVSESNIKQVRYYMAKGLFPELLLRPMSKSEIGISVSYDRQAMMDYYLFLCKTLGIKNELEEKPTVKFL